MDKKTDYFTALIRSVEASFPGFASVAQAWSESDSVKQKERVDSFFNDFITQLKNHEDRIKKVEVHLKESGEAPILFEKTIDIIIREPIEDKRNIFPIVLKNLILKGAIIDYGTKLDYLQLIDFLTQNDIDILTLFYPEKNLRINEISELNKIDLERLIFSISKLESRGLISLSNNESVISYSHGSPSHWKNMWKVRDYEILSTGRELIELVQL